MSQATIKQMIPKSIARRLSALRRQLKQWVLVSGVSRWLLIALAVLAVDILLDRVFKMDFAQRLIMLCVMLVTIGAFFFWRIIKPLSKSATDDALLRFEERGVSAELAQATIDKGANEADKIDIGRIIDRPQHTKNLALLGVGGLLALGLLFGVMTSDFLGTWFNRNILWKSRWKSKALAAARFTK